MVALRGPRRGAWLTNEGRVVAAAISADMAEACTAMAFAARLWLAHRAAEAAFAAAAEAAR